MPVGLNPRKRRSRGGLDLPGAGVGGAGLKATSTVVALAGFVMGGDEANGAGTTIITGINKLAWPAETISTLSATISSARRLLTGLSDTGVAGYAAGGMTGTTDATRVATVDKLSFSAETRSTLGTGLGSARSQAGGTGMSNPAVAGYFPGGRTTVAVTTVDKFAFPSDTQSTTTALPATRIVAGSFSNPAVAGYAGGGLVGGSASTTVVKLAFSNDASANLGTGLSLARYHTNAFDDEAVAGYTAGGEDGNPRTTVDKFAFPSDTRSVLASGLTAARARAAGLSQWAVGGYVAGGWTIAADLDSIEKFAFPSDTRSVLAAVLTSARVDTAGASNNG